MINKTSQNPRPLYSPDYDPRYKEIPRRYSRSPFQTDLPQREDQQKADELRRMQVRYQQILEKYHEVLQETRIKNKEHMKIKQQLEHYQKLHHRDTQEIERLRCIIGLIKKKSVATQIEEEHIDSSALNRASRINKFDQSTQDEIRFKNSAEKFNSREKTSPFRTNNQEDNYESQGSSKDLLTRSSYMKNKPKYGHFDKMNCNSSTTIARQAVDTNKISKKLSNSPYSRYRFIPGAALK